MNYPTVSVVIATRNRPQMLRVAIDAVMNQTYAGPIECIVVFDRTEPDVELLRSETARTVVVTENSRTGGLAGARNSGILLAQGDLVAFCDDDDVWLPSKLEKQVAALGSAYTSVTGIVIDYGGRTAVRIPDQASFTLQNLVRNRIMEAHPSSVMMRRDALLEHVGLVDEELPGSYAEDFDFILRAAQAGQISVVDEALVKVHWGQSLFSRDWGVIREAIDYLLAKHEVLRTDRKASARLYGRRAFASAGLGDRRQAFRDCWTTWRLQPLQQRIYVTLPVAMGLITAEQMLDLAHKRGRGI